MKASIFGLLIAIFGFQNIASQVVLNANEAGNTYEDINAVLAPGYDVVEVPDCAHTDFGRHIDEVFDKELNTNVFRFISHVTTDNDRCKKDDRQRVEIKSYSSSPENLKGIEGETVVYKWKFKLPSGFKSSKGFTHLHQIKSIGSEYSSIPIFTLTTRKGTPDQLELRHAPTLKQSTLKKVNLDQFKGHWVEVTERIHYSDNGSYSIIIKRLSDGSELLKYETEDLDTWQDGSTFMRPKWGVYRSLKNSEDLQDETVLFNEFSIQEVETIIKPKVIKLDVTKIKAKADSKLYMSDSGSDTVTFEDVKFNKYDTFKIFSTSGEEFQIKESLKKDKLNISELKTGIYYFTLFKSDEITQVLKFLVN